MSAIETLRDALFGNPPSPTREPSREGVLAAFTELNATVAAIIAEGGDPSEALAVIQHAIDETNAAAAAAEESVDDAEAASALAGQYANANTDAPIPGAPSGERGALYWVGRAKDVANASIDADVPGFEAGTRGAKFWSDKAGTQVAAGIAAGVAVVDVQAADSQARLVEQLSINTSRLYGAVAAHGKALPGDFTYSGDSLIATSVGTYTTASNRAYDVALQFITPSGASSNDAVNGRHMFTITNAFLAQSPSLYTAFGITNGGTNDVAQYASSLMGVTITSAGTGGTDGTYAFAISPAPAGSGGVAATGTFSVSGGAITAVNITNRGGGYTASQVVTISTAAAPGLTGAVLTPVFDTFSSVMDNLARLMNVTNGKRIIMAPWFGSATRRGGAATGTYSNSRAWALCRKIQAAEIAAYGARVFDGLAFLLKFQSASPADQFLAANGLLPPSFSYTVAAGAYDGQHPADPVMGALGREQALMIRAHAGIGAPYIHDSNYVGVKAGAAAGTALHALRILGSPIYSPRIVQASKQGVAVMSQAAPWTINQGSVTPDAITELMVEGDSLGKGPTNRARVALVRLAADDTASQIVRIKGNGGSILRTAGLTETTSKQLTIAMLVRRNGTQVGAGHGYLGSNLQNNEFTWLSRNVNGSWALTTRNVAGTAVGALNGPAPTVPNDEFNLIWFTYDSAAGIMRAGVNEQAYTSIAPTANADLAVNLISEIYQTASGNPDLVTFSGDEKFFWMADQYLDLSVPANRALFYNPGTKAPAAIPADGTIAGIRPLLYLCGMAGDRLVGKNRGKGGDLYAPPYINRDLVGFMDIAA